MVIIWNMHHL